jgi:hypothetical protein
MPKPLPAFLIALGVASGFAQGAGTQSIRIRIDTSGPRLTHVGLGFLNGYVFSDSAGIRYGGSDEIRPLAIRANVSYGFDMHREPRGRFRAFQGFPYLRKRQAQGLVQVVLSDEWPKSTYPYSPSAPADSAAWEFTVRTCIESAVDRFGIGNVQADLFNEPEGKFSPSVDQASLDAFLNRRPVASTPYFENWKRTVRFIRSRIEPYRRVAIVGPSITGYHPFLLEFLKAAQAENVLPDVISWHELDKTSKWDLDSSVDRVRAFLREQGIPDRPISINEYMGEEETRSPGIAIAFFSKLEAAGVASAMRGCWGADCRDGNFNGLYARQGDAFLPRSIWWSYRWYAGLSGARILPRLAPPAAAVGAWDSAGKKIEILFANADGTARMPKGELLLEAIPAALRGACRLSVEVLRDSGEAPYARPKRLTWKKTKVGDPALTIPRPELGPGDALRILLQREE